MAENLGYPSGEDTGSTNSTPASQPSRRGYDATDSGFLGDGTRNSYPLDNHGNLIIADEVDTERLSQRDSIPSRRKRKATTTRSRQELTPIRDETGRVTHYVVPAGELQFEEEDTSEADTVAEIEIFPVGREVAETLEKLNALPDERRTALNEAIQLTARKLAGEANLTAPRDEALDRGDAFIGDDFTNDDFDLLVYAYEDAYRARFAHRAATQTTGGTPVLSDGAEVMAARLGIARTRVPSYRHFATLSKHLDDEGNLKFWPWATYNLRVAWTRWGPLVPLGAGWLWKPIYSRAEMLQAWAQGVGPAPVSRLAARRGLFFTGLGLAATILLLAALVLTVSSFGQLGHLTNIFSPTQPAGGASLGGCNLCNTVTVPSGVGSDATATTSSGANTGGACGASCGGANPTPGGPTPTSVPVQPSDIYASKATISFTRASQSVNSPPTLITCDGCANDAVAGTQRGQKITGSALGAAGAYNSAYVQTSGATYSVLTITYTCLSGANGCFTGSGTRIVDQSGNGHDCYLLDSAFADAGASDYPRCQAYQTGPISHFNTVYYPYRPPTGGSGSAQMQSIISESVGRDASYAWYTPGNCTGQGDSAARANALGALGGALGGGLGADAIGVQGSITGVWCSPPGNCNAQYGSNQYIGTSTYYVCANASGWKLTYAPGDAPIVQKGRLAAPAGYSLDNSTLTACSSSSVQSVDVGNVRATIACQATGTARFAWTTAMSDTLAANAAGKTFLEAVNLVEGTIGVAGSSAQISAFSPSNAVRMPRSASAISVAPQ